MTSSKTPEDTETLKDVAEDLAHQAETMAETIADHVEDAADGLSARLAHASNELVSAKRRMKRELSRVGEAFREFSKDAERPATRVARALDDLSYEARRSFEKVTAKPRPSFLSKLPFFK